MSDETEVRSDIDRMYRRVRAAETTEDRIGVFKHCRYDLPDLDNYDIRPGSDPVFEAGWHRWLYLFQLTTGVERASIMAIAFELFRSSDLHKLHGFPGFFELGFSESSRDMFYAKAMCIAYRNMLTED